MSKQLAISSSFCTFALAAMALFASPDTSGLHGVAPFIDLKAEAISLDPLAPSFFRD